VLRSPGGPSLPAVLKAYGPAREWVRTASPEAVAEAGAPFFPQVPAAALTDAIRRYQMLRCWDGSVGIPRDLYEQALNVFESEDDWARGTPMTRW
jgi:hypothetical protein